VNDRSRVRRPELIHRVIMPYLKKLIPVCVHPDQAKIYFRQLASAIGYLHERGITHNDIKPSNVLLSYTNIPVLVDFGFATRWDMNSPSAFLSTIDWGTPEVRSQITASGFS
jgi:protein-serine/threonine kinase